MASYGLAAVVFLMAPVAIFSSKAMMPLMIIALVIVVLSSNDRLAGFRHIPGYLWVGFGLLGAWGMLSALWSVTPGVTLRTAGAVWLTIYAGLYLIGCVSSGLINPAYIRRALLWGVTLAIALLIFEQLSAGFLMRAAKNVVVGPLYEFPVIRMGHLRDGTEVNLPSFYINGTVILTIIVWPLVAFLHRDGAWVKLILMGAAVLWAVISYGSSAALLALAGGTFVVVAGSLSRRLTSVVLAVSVAASFLVAPVLPNVLLKSKDIEALANRLPSVGIPFANANRLFIWNFVGQKITDRPILGWGLRASRAIPGANEKYTLSIIEPDGRKRPVIIDYYIPLHPHNQPLQVWLELGIIGALILVSVLGRFLWRNVAPLGPPGVQWQFGPIAAGLVYGYLSFGAWQSWWLATLLLGAGVMMVSVRHRDPPTGSQATG